MQTRRSSSNGFTPESRKGSSGPSSTSALQLKSSLRGQDFSTQEAMLKPGSDLGSGVKSGPPIEKGDKGDKGEKGDKGTTAPKTEGGPEPVQMKGLMSNLRGGGWKVTGYMPQMPLENDWHASVYCEGAKGPKSDGMFFDGFHLTWGSAPGGAAPHIFYKHDGTIERGRSLNHGQTRRYEREFAGRNRNGGRDRWPSLDSLISFADGKASTIAGTLGEEIDQQRAIELEKQAEEKKLREAEELKLANKKQDDEKWVSLENDKSKDQSVVAWMRENGFGPSEYMYWGSTGKPKDSDKTHGELRRAEHDGKKPKVEPVVEEVETVVEETEPEVDEVVEIGEPKVEAPEVREPEVTPVIGEAPKTNTKTKQPTPPPKKKGGKGGQKKGGKGKFRKKKGGNKRG